MAETLSISGGADRTQVYSEIAPQISSLIEGETDLIANLANVAAALKQAFGFFWVGFYLVKGGQLVLGPFQGPIACTRIRFDQGVCGSAYSTRQTVIVSDVEKFPGHIPCSSNARSEIVVPVFDADGEVSAVLDIDSDRLDDFSEIDRIGLMRIVESLKI
jgi:GAF domain-containing protein